MSVWRYWQIFSTHIIVAITTFFVSAYIYNSLIRPSITFGGWAELIIEGGMYLITISALATTAFYITSKGFRDVAGRIKLFKRINK